VTSTRTGEGVFSSVTEKLIPRLHKLVLPFLTDSLDRTQLGWSESDRRRKRNIWKEPKLCLRPITRDMYVRRLIPLIREE
jgi:hypothetical protein